MRTRFSRDEMIRKFALRRVLGETKKMQRYTWKNEGKVLRDEEELKVEEGKSLYYIGGALVATWDGSIIYINIDVTASNALYASRRANDLYWIVFQEYLTRADAIIDGRYRIYPSNKRWGTASSWPVEFSYPVSVNIKEGKIYHSFDGILDKFLRSRENAKSLLWCIEAYNVKIPDEYVSRIKKKKLKMALDEATR